MEDEAGSVGVRKVSRSPANTLADADASCGVTAMRVMRAVLALAGGDASGTASARTAVVC